MNQKNIIFKKVQIDNNWSLFMDRDGVINKRIESNYVKRPEEFELLPGIIESLKHFSEIFGKIFIVTNQQGVKRGIMTEEELLKVHNYMLNLIHNNGGHILLYLQKKRSHIIFHHDRVHIIFSIQIRICTP